MSTDRPGSVTANEGSSLPNGQTKLVIVLYELSLLFWHFINTTDPLGQRYEPSFPYTKKLHG